MESSKTRPDWYASNASCRYVGTVSVSQPTSTASGRSACHSCVSMFVKPTTALRRIDFGSEWYARCANESPSTRAGRSQRRLELLDGRHQAVGRLLRVE